MANAPYRPFRAHFSARLAGAGLFKSSVSNSFIFGSLRRCRR